MLDFPLNLTEEEFGNVDLYKILHIKLDSRVPLLKARAKVKLDRARHAFHRLSQKYHPRYGTALHLTIEDTTLAFQEICFALNTLKDKSRKRVYDTMGMKALYQHENCMEQSIFDEKADNVYDDFFAGTDKDDKLYLLLNGPNKLTDSEDDDEFEEANDEVTLNQQQITGTSKRDAHNIVTNIVDEVNRVEVEDQSVLEVATLKKDGSRGQSDGIDSLHADDHDEECPLPSEIIMENLKSKVEAEKELQQMEDSILKFIVDGPASVFTGGFLNATKDRMPEQEKHTIQTKTDMWAKLQSVKNTETNLCENDTPTPTEST